MCFVLPFISLPRQQQQPGIMLVLWQVLNEVVVDRGPSSYLSNVDVFLDGHLITTVQGDGECCWSCPSSGPGCWVSLEDFLSWKQSSSSLLTANTSVQRMGVFIPTVKLSGAERFCSWACEGK